ncbi:diguanylate cyclase [Thermoleptolyngbya sp. C42_A2020_037]|uniref:GGDEF domain-containing response regulator n=1 Tax=Thermoleptolyngbya sp. C42_A2020_037 TaxID=2747799 RepID=UPI0019E23157|nr:diguanylate cyclase [Thermoleptolyngbya sp. C42_A2020_037]MBF2085993.1 diguanylate cyclase [Thermoleptolyngbya sp. C42_A2020_037]
MDASILIVGDREFLASLSALTPDLAAFTLEVAPNPHEATPLIQAQQPDLLIIQATQPGSLDLCQRVKAQSHLAWIYCVVVDDRQPPLVGELGDRPQDEAHLETSALIMGADAYVKLWRAELQNKSSEKSDQSLISAYVQAGLRRVQNHRELIRTNDILSAIALSDPLTELNNRRAFEWELPRQIHNARLRGMPISLLMLDVDFFKSINDTYGHLVGDRALQLIASRLRHNLRFYDTPFRYGGEEFVIILSDTGNQEAEAIANRICRLISDQPFVIDDSLDLNITISAGTASLLVQDDARGISLLRRADQNLLRAKALGRNRVVGGQESDAPGESGLGNPDPSPAHES